MTEFISALVLDCKPEREEFDFFKIKFSSYYEDVLEQKKKKSTGLKCLETSLFSIFRKCYFSWLMRSLWFQV